MLCAVCVVATDVERRFNGVLSFSFDRVRTHWVRLRARGAVHGPTFH